MTAERARRTGRIGLVVLLGAFSATDVMRFSEDPTTFVLLGLVVAAVAALLFRGVPWYVAALLTTATGAVFGHGFLWALMCVALYDLAFDRHVRYAVGCVAALMAGETVGDLTRGSWAASHYAGLLLLSSPAILAGLWRGSRRRMVELLAGQVEHLKVEAALREETARLGERARIAAEMHDVLAHRLSLIALHTGVLVTRPDDLPQRVTDRLRLLRSTSTEALADLRDVLGALRAPQTTGTGPTVGSLRDLMRDGRSAGQNIELVVDGDPKQVPTAHRLAAYRIVQEALTNARKHAVGAPVTVQVDYRPPATTVQVANAAGRPAPDITGSGYGLIGLRERLSSLGGHLTAGPVGTGAWQLEAHIPHPHTEQNDPTP